MGEKPALRPGVPVVPALGTIAHDIIAEARAALDDPVRTDAVAVHDYRKAMKRWRALLKLLRPFLGADGERLRLEARDFARRLAGARDVQAALDALSDVGKAAGRLSPASMATTRGRIEAIKRAAETTTLTAELREELRAALDSAARAANFWRLDELDFADVAAELARHYGRARSAIPGDWLEAEPEALHELRQRVVEHRYQMELIEPVWPRLGKLWTGEAQRLRERLGSHQDLVVLSRLTAPHQALAPWRSRLTPLIEERKGVHVAAAQRLAGRLFAERPKAFRRRLEALWKSRIAIIDEAAEKSDDPAL
jgi:CHAD domain-containing protein